MTVHHHIASGVHCQPGKQLLKPVLWFFLHWPRTPRGWLICYPSSWPTSILAHGFAVCVVWLAFGACRSFSYTAQQQVAMKLNKLHPNELYQWWVVASLALQAHAAAVQARLAPAAAGSTSSSSQVLPAGGGGAGLGADKLLALAEAMAGRLLGKAPAQGGQHSWESVMMYLGLLQAQVGEAGFAVVGRSKALVQSEKQSLSQPRFCVMTSTAPYASHCTACEDENLTIVSPVALPPDAGQTRCCSSCGARAIGCLLLPHSRAQGSQSSNPAS